MKLEGAFSSFLLILVHTKPITQRCKPRDLFLKKKKIGRFFSCPVTHSLGFPSNFGLEIFVYMRAQTRKNLLFFFFKNRSIGLQRAVKRELQIL